LFLSFWYIIIIILIIAITKKTQKFKSPEIAKTHSYNILKNILCLQKYEYKYEPVKYLQLFIFKLQQNRFYPKLIFRKYSRFHHNIRL